MATVKKLPITFEASDIVELQNKIFILLDDLNTLNKSVDNAVGSDKLLQLVSITEALESTKIEGTQTSLSEVIEANTTNKDTIDTREVKNYQEALKYGIEQIKNGYPLTINLLKKVHEILLDGNVRGRNKNPGEFRKIQNWIGESGATIESASHIPPAANEIMELMGNLEAYINDDSMDTMLHPIIKVAIIHAQFETIHPFLDGNGRVGRILIVLYLFFKGIINSDSFFLSEELEKNKFKYYDLLNGCRKNPPEWKEWIMFFIESASKQAIKQTKKLEEANKLFDRYYSLKDSISYRKVVVAIFVSPIFDINKIVDMTGYTKNTVAKHIQFLKDAKLIYANQKKRNTLYFVYDLLNIFAE